MDVLVILFLSFVPMFIYAVFLWWLDRFEKEPLGLLLFAFFWGAIPAVILALIVEIILDIPISALATSAFTYDFLGSAIAAPLVEETAKGLAVLLLFLFIRREFDSPVDGLIYGGMAGFGFAAVENFFYFLSAYEDGGMGAVFGLAFLRAFLFGLNHAMFTGFTGLGLAMALEAKSVVMKLLYPMAGFIIAVSAHAFHNGFATISGYGGGEGPVLLAIFSDWGGVFILLVVAWATKRVESKRIARFLARPELSERIPVNEAAMLISPRRRRAARLSALLHGDVGRWAKLGRYFQRVSDAALNDHRARQGHVAAQKRDAQMRQKMFAARDALLNDK